MQYLSIFVTATLLISQIFSCKDASPECAAWNKNGYCASKFYDDARKSKYCALTCGFCTSDGVSDSTSDGEVTSSDETTLASDTSSTASSTCVDASPSCPSFVKNGFCTESFYSEAVRRKTCAKSCNLC